MLTCENVSPQPGEKPNTFPPARSGFIQSPAKDTSPPLSRALPAHLVLRTKRAYHISVNATKHPQKIMRTHTYRAANVSDNKLRTADTWGPVLSAAVEAMGA